jgi:hypothetical protein
MQIKSTYKAIRKRPFLLAIPAFFDLLAMFLFGYTLVDIRNRALNVIVDMQALLEKSTNLSMEALNQTNIVEMFSQQSDLVSIEASLIKLLFILIFAFWIIWLFFQGGSWRYASWISGNKGKFFKYMGKFVLLNLFWLSAITLVNVFLLNHQLGLQLEFHKTFLDFLTIIGIICNFLIAYFMFISYTFISGNKLKRIFKKTFSIGIKQPLKILSFYFVIAIGFVVIDLLLRLIGLIGPTTAFFAGILLLLPYLTIARVFLIKNIQDL